MILGINSFLKFIRLAENVQLSNNEGIPVLENNNQLNLTCSRCDGFLATQNAIMCDSEGSGQIRPRCIIIYSCINMQCQNFIPFTDLSTGYYLNTADLETGERISVPIYIIRSVVGLNLLYDIIGNEEIYNGNNIDVEN